MDILVVWEDGSENVVALKDVHPVIGHRRNIREGSSIKMFWREDKKWYFGKVREIERTEYDTDYSENDDLPLATYKNAISSVTVEGGNVFPDNDTSSPIITELQNVDFIENPSAYQDGHYCVSDGYYSGKDPTYESSCEIGTCQQEVFAACPIACNKLVCYDHLVNSDCGDNHIIREIHHQNQEDENRTSTPVLRNPTVNENQEVLPIVPETFEVDGCPREEGTENANENHKRINRKKLAKELRNKGEEYKSPKTGKIIPARKNLKERCNGEICRRYGRKCLVLTNEERWNILSDFYKTGSLQLQREYIVRYVKVTETKRSTTKAAVSRRQNTLHYFLPKEHEEVSVCKQLFLNTLSISERTVRTALEKKKATGIVEKEKRGGRHINLKENDMIVRNAIMDHIKRFPRMESHYCRSSSKKEYLHPDLNIKRMLDMFNTEHKDDGIQSTYFTYHDVYKSLNLAIHHPKKDQCGLCSTFRTCSDPARKSELEDRYNQHIAEKKTVRQKKQEAKVSSDNDEKSVCASFDLQQVIFLPISNESQIFYRRRLSNYNFTVYNIGTKDCHCFLWHEAISKRGSSEIATCVMRFLRQLDAQGVREVFLFSDGCSGQNKNTAVAAMLLHTVSTSENIKTISLRFFEPYHGQNEGDSAHSAINMAIKRTGDLLTVPSQLVPVLRLARNQKPYIVHCMESKDFLNFKKMAADLRILTVRVDDDGLGLDWKNIREIMVHKDNVDKVYFKTSHLNDLYRSITLKRQALSPATTPSALNVISPRISAEKYKDLMALCKGDTPVVRNAEFVDFYKNLPHS